MSEQVDFWSYGYNDGYIEIWFDKQQRCLKISEKDLKSMLDWVNMFKNGLIK